MEVELRPEPTLPRIEDEGDRHTVSLAYKSAAIVDAFPDRLPNARELEEMTTTFGIELVSMSLVQILSRITPNKYFYEQVDSAIRGLSRDERNPQAALTAPLKGPPLAERFELTIIESTDPYTPGVKWGSHVEQWRSWGRKAGLTTEVIQTDRRKGLIENAEIIRRELALQPHDRRIIATLGQGGAEFRLLLEQLMKVAPEELEGVRAWVNVAGIIRGASVVESRRRRFWDRRYEELSSLLRGRPRSISRQLSSANPRLRQEVDLGGLPLVCVSLVGMPRLSEVPVGLKQNYMNIVKTAGPNDGLTTFHQSIVRPGYVVAVPGMSHKAEADRLAPWFVATLKALTKR